MPLASASQVIEHALRELVAREEKAKYAATEHPRAPRASRRARYIPAHVKRTVWKRDGGRCTFVGADGHVCGSPELVEYDHGEPVARGGAATIENVRLRCRAHNQYEAEKAFGADFMRRKREERKAPERKAPERKAPERKAPERKAPERTRAPG